MTRYLIYLAFIAGQVGTLNTLQDKPVVRLSPHKSSIPIEYGGDLVELKNAPPTVELPQRAPTMDSHGHTWLIDVRNLGPGTVTVVGRPQFSVQLTIGKTAHIKSTGTGYSVAP